MVRANPKALGSYDISHETTVKGEYAIHVELDGQEIDGSPACFTVQPAVPTAIRSRLAPPETQPQTHQPCELLLTAVDKLGNTLDRGGARVDARVLGPNASPCTVEDCKDGRYKITFTAGAVGEYRVIARLDNVEMLPMPLQFAEGRPPVADALEKPVQSKDSKSDAKERPGRALPASKRREGSGKDTAAARKDGEDGVVEAPTAVEPWFHASQLGHLYPSISCTNAAASTGELVAPV